MIRLRSLLILCAVAILAAATVHALLGLHAETALGIEVPAETLSNPGADSQNRFLGSAFALYGILLLYYQRNVLRYKSELYILIGVFWLSGLVRLSSFFLYGAPPLAIVGLTLVEIIVPPVLLLWIKGGGVK
jgi:hypothetical protein